MGYGTGAIFASGAIPAIWICRNGDLPVRAVVLLPMQIVIQIADTAHTGDGVMFNSGDFDGLSPADGARDYRAICRAGRGTRQVNLVARLGYFAPAILGLPDPDDPLPRLRCRSVPRA